MNEMLTAKEMQSLLQVDRSTIYRMAESGRLPAIKVGKQWRFPVEQVEDWLRLQAPILATVKSSNAAAPQGARRQDDLEPLLPRECVQLIQDTFADLLGIMMVVTDIEGNPITRPSHPCGLFDAISQVPSALKKCIESWQAMATAIDLEPQFSRTHLGLLCTRAMIRVGTELKGMVVAGCVAPEDWPPSAGEVAFMASELGVEPEVIEAHQAEVFDLDESQRLEVLAYMQRIANIVAHIVNERKTLVGRLEAIADLTAL